MTTAALWVPERIALVTGSRDWPKAPRHTRVIADAIADFAPNLLLHGKARGADTTAHVYAEVYFGDSERHHIWPIPYFEHLGKYGGYARNIAMVNIVRAYHELGSQALVLAFPIRADFKGGTWQCLKVALKAGLPVRAWNIDGEEPWKERLSEGRTRDSLSAPGS